MKTLFFFGSGADSDYCDRLKSGQSFVSALLLGNYKSEAENLNGSEFKTYKLIYPSSTKFYLQTIAAYPNEAKKVIDPSVVKMCLDYFNKNNEVTFIEVKNYCTRWYRNVMDENDTTGIRDFFLNYAVFFDSLDEKFNSLRLIELNDSAKRVIDAYTQVFVLMLKSLYNIDDDFSWKYNDVFQKLNCPYDIINDSSNSSYYCALKKSGLKADIVTTNYTSLAEDKTGRHTIYLHGKLTWFEDLKKLTVYDCTDSTERELLNKSDRILPFILIPSGVKPLICPKQIEEFSSFIEKLRATNILVVVGYKFNSEDNHINSIIADWLRKENKKMIYLNFKDEVSFNKMIWAKDFSVIRIEQLDDESLKKTIDKKRDKERNKKKDEKIVCISINPDSSHDVFEKVLLYLEEQSR